jgi:hypothetical protein
MTDTAAEQPPAEVLGVFSHEGRWFTVTDPAALAGQAERVLAEGTHTKSF